MTVDDIVRDELLILRELGFDYLDLSRRPGDVDAPAVAAPDVSALSGRRSEIVPDSPIASTPAAAARAFVHDQINDTAALIGETLDELAAIAAACTRCRLSETRTQVVWGTGNPNADLMFVGEAPGRDEDIAGAPFVGRAGQLLTDIIKAMGLTRDDVYISNVVKCRPPENRNPESDELDACRPYIKRQIELIKPRVVVTLGRFALQSTLERAVSISAARGEWISWNGLKLMPTYHPAYLLRTPSAKKDVWNDMKKVMRELGMTFGG